MLSDSVAWLFQPCLWNRLQSAQNAAELRALENAGRDGQLDGAIRSFYANDLKVRGLNPISLGRLVLPALGVLVANMLRVVALLTADLTNLRHENLAPSDSLRWPQDDTRAAVANARGIGELVGCRTLAPWQRNASR